MPRSLILTLFLLLPIGCRAQCPHDTPKPDGKLYKCIDDKWVEDVDDESLSWHDAYTLEQTIRAEMKIAKHNPLKKYEKDEMSAVQHDLDYLYDKTIDTPYVDRVRKLGEDYAALVRKDEELQHEGVI